MRHKVSILFGFDDVIEWESVDVRSQLERSLETEKSFLKEHLTGHFELGSLVLANPVIRRWHPFVVIITSEQTHLIKNTSEDPEDPQQQQQQQPKVEIEDNNDNDA